MQTQNDEDYKIYSSILLSIQVFIMYVCAYVSK